MDLSHICKIKRAIFIVNYEVCTVVDPLLLKYYHWKIAKNMMLIDWKIAGIVLF